MSKALIIAEAGVNHNGSLALALELVDAAIAADVDIVKFQTFQSKSLVTADAQQAKYQSENTDKVESQQEMLSRLELTFDEHLTIKTYCDNNNIEYLSTAFDSESLKFLVDKLNLSRLKIPSGEINNAPFILEHAQTGCDLIISTGMSTINEIEVALGVIAFGLLYPNNEKPPSKSNFQQAFESQKGQELLRKKVIVLHCTTEYPAPLPQVNLAAMALIKETFKLPVGYSDHTEGIVVPVVAVAHGACIVEKHFTLSRDLDGPDHKASIEPDELCEMVNNIRVAELVVGDKVKEPSLIEEQNKAVIRKSIVAKVPILSGEKFSSKNITVMRPGTGLSPMNYWQLIGKKTNRAFAAGELISIT